MLFALLGILRVAPAGGHLCGWAAGEIMVGLLFVQVVLFLISHRDQYKCKL